jgi:hypothetical protein
METPKPSAVSVKPVNLATDFELTPKPKPRAERSAPVRNPAFREHEGLRALQKQLNSRNNKNK